MFNILANYVAIWITKLIIFFFCKTLATGLAFKKLKCKKNMKLNFQN